MSSCRRTKQRWSECAPAFSVPCRQSHLAADTFAPSDAWTKPNRSSRTTFPRSSRRVCCGTISSGLPCDVLSCVCCSRAATFRQEVEPVDEQGNGGKPVVTGILQGMHLFRDFKNIFCLIQAPASRRLQLPLPSHLELRCSVRLHERVRVIHQSRRFAPVTHPSSFFFLLPSYSATRCMSGADARDDSPQKLRRTKDGNIAPPWPNKVTMFLWQFFVIVAIPHHHPPPFIFLFSSIQQVLQNIHHAKSLAPPPRPNLPLPSLPPNHSAAIGNLGSRCPTPMSRLPNPSNPSPGGKSSKPALPRPNTGEVQLLLVADAMKKRQHAWRTAFRFKTKRFICLAFNPFNMHSFFFDVIC